MSPTNSAYGYIDVTPSRFEAIARVDGEVVKMVHQNYHMRHQVMPALRSLTEDLAAIGLTRITIGVPEEWNGKNSWVRLPIYGDEQEMYVLLDSEKLTAGYGERVRVQPRISLVTAFVTAQQAANFTPINPTAGSITAEHTVAVVSINHYGIEIAIRRRDGEILWAQGNKPLWAPTDEVQELIVGYMREQSITPSYDRLLRGCSADLRSMLTRMAGLARHELMCTVLASLLASLLQEHPDINGYMLLDDTRASLKHWLHQPPHQRRFMSHFCERIEPLVGADRCAQLPVWRYIGDHRTAYLEGGLMASTVSR